MLKNKTLITNLVALAIIIGGFIFQSSLFKTIGFFAISGSITNSIAIFMIFEKVPFLYGSGVILLKFEEFKRSIKNMILKQFFSQEKLDKFFASKTINIKQFVSTAEVFEKLKSAILTSEFGGMINMFGGEKALEPLRSPMELKLSEMIAEVEGKIKSKSESLIQTAEVEKILEERLAELTAKEIKILIENIIKEHLSMLVVWGGVFGGLLGAISFFFI